MRLLVFDDPALERRHQWLAHDSDVHAAMRTLAWQAYRLHRRQLPDVQLAERLRAHATIDARPYAPPSAG